jgi:uncharacterized repeat protein (TIGR01451 family)
MEGVVRGKRGVLAAGAILAGTLALAVLAAGGASAAVGATDLSLTKADTADPVIVGDSFAYVITVKNTGANDAGDVIVTDTLPSEVTWVSTTPSQIATGKSCEKSGSKITCDLGQVNAGASATVTIAVKASRTGTASDTASLTSADDTVATNNLDSETTTINRAPATPSPPKTTKKHKRVAQSCASPTIVGTFGDDVIQGTNGPDVIVALAGNDQVFTGGGNDLVCAGAGTDLVDVGSGKDFVNGGGGPDRLIGEDGADTLKGKNGRDHLSGGRGNDLLVGGKGRDKCRGGPGHNVLVSCR